ncbi:MAG: FAD:protein FMN transferase, partial [Clostridiales bacterium]|nr:FAD:protein FMN transferase [Clostridiales bacterium]
MTGKRGGIWLAAVGMCLMLAGCSQEKTTARTGFYLDTVVELTIYGGEPETADKAMELIAHYDRLFSPEGEESDIVRMNQASGQPVTVDADTASLLQLACRCAERTGGAFDPTIGPAAALWDFQREPPVVPEEEALSRAAALTDWRSVSVDGCRVTLTGEGRAVNLGGVAKGYIADRVRDYLAEQGVERA